MVSLREKPVSSVRTERSGRLPQCAAASNPLMTMIFFSWLSQKTQQPFHILNGCSMARSGFNAVSPDLMLYVGDDYPQWTEGEARYLNLEKWRVPDLVGEVGDTTIATDLDEKKQLYAAIGIPEYWVVDVKASRVFAFRLDAFDRYQQIETSIALEGLPIDLLERSPNSMKANPMAKRRRVLRRRFQIWVKLTIFNLYRFPTQ
jgi:hypothetical protein